MHHIPPIVPHLELWFTSWLTTAGPLIVFLVTFIEGIPPVGLFSPSHSVVLFAAFLASVGVFSFPDLVLAALGGMILGDIVGYFMGWRYGYGFLERLGRIFSLKPERLEKLKNLVSGHLGKTFLFGKFNPVTRSLVPFAVGASRVSFGRFLIVDILCNAAWTALAIAIGSIFGASYALAAAYLGRVIVIGILLAVLISILYRFINRQFHVFARYELLALIANVIATFGLAAMLQGISGRHHFMVGADVIVNLWFSSLASMHSFLVGLASFTSGIFSALVFAAAAIGLPIFFIIKKRWRRLIITVFSLATAFSITEFLKGFIQSPRPPDALVPISPADFGFPSAHCAAAGAILVLVVYFFVPLFRSRQGRTISVFVALFIALAVGASRLMLSVHWLSDVVAGYSVGILSATSLILIVRYGDLLWQGIKKLQRES